MDNDIVIKQGATYQALVTWYQDKAKTQPVDLTSAHAKFQVRLTEETPDPPLVDLSDGAGLVLGGVAGTIAITISAAVTAALTGWKEAVCELLVTASGGTKTSLFVKPVTLKLGVIR